jgi:hypothetical protein
MRRLTVLVVLAACGDDASAPDAGWATCVDPPGPIAAGDPVGHADPLGAGPVEARAGRIRADQLPPVESGLLTWADGDFVLANDRVAIVIEDVGESDLYDPWGGRPVGIARVAGGALIEPTDFGEVFLLTGRSTVVTTRVTVIADGSSGGPAIVRATGRLAPLPFLDGLLGALYADPLTDVEAAIDYVLAPGAEVVEIRLRLASPRGRAVDLGPTMHGLGFARRTPPMVPGRGFTEAVTGPWILLVDDDATSWGYQEASGARFGSTVAQAGFIGTLAGERSIPPCAETELAHARILIGGPGLDGLEQARARLEARRLRTITGVTAPGARVHVTGDAGYLTRTTAGPAGDFAVHVPADAAVTLTAYQRGWQVGTAEVAAGEAVADVPLPPVGAIHVVATGGDGSPLPVRVQVLPVDGALPSVPASFGEPGTVAGRLHVEFPITGDVTLPAPPGTWRVVVSRGFEYELVDTEVEVVAGATVAVDAVLDRVVDTAGVQCGDFHIHTHRSLDAGDDARDKLRSAVADGVELPVRSEHDYVDSFQPLIDELGLGAWAFGIGSIEVTSNLVWGHLGAFPIEPDPTRPNGGAVPWQRWPTATAPDAPVETLGPRAVLEALRALPDDPAIVINHPRQYAQDYFNYVGFDPATGAVSRPDQWDDRFTLLEVFNASDTAQARAETVADWYGLLALGRRVFAVGSSDTHHLRVEPLGYPRTCVAVGTDDPAALTADAVRDAMRAGATTISGGIFVDLEIAGAGPGQTATGVGPIATATVRVQAASWVDVDALDVIVDGEVVDTIDAGRFSGTVSVPVAAAGSWVIVWARGDAALEPVHPDRMPFGVTNPIFLRR